MGATASFGSRSVTWTADKPAPAGPPCEPEKRRRRSISLQGVPAAHAAAAAGMAAAEDPLRPTTSGGLPRTHALQFLNYRSSGIRVSVRPEACSVGPPGRLAGAEGLLAGEEAPASPEPSTPASSASPAGGRLPRHREAIAVATALFGPGSDRGLRLAPDPLSLPPLAVPRAPAPSARRTGVAFAAGRGFDSDSDDDAAFYLYAGRMTAPPPSRRGALRGRKPTPYPTCEWLVEAGALAGGGEAACGAASDSDGSDEGLLDSTRATRGHAPAAAAPAAAGGEAGVLAEVCRLLAGHEPRVVLPLPPRAPLAAPAPARPPAAS